MRSESRTFQLGTNTSILSPVTVQPEPARTYPNVAASLASEDSYSPESNSGTMNRVPLIPGLTRGLASKAWEQVVKDWEEADPDRSLYVAMKDWEPQWHKLSNLTQKYGQRKTVALEFIEL
jgi:hypothetical protein